MSADLPDIIAEVAFFTSEEGGRKSAATRTYGCIFVIDNECFECVLLLSQDKQRKINPGDTVTIPIQFLWPEHVKDRISVGKTFLLRELRVVARGRVVEVLFPQRKRSLE
jgi:translation elongation factor EF-Tu-like GTPase